MTDQPAKQSIPDWLIIAVGIIVRGLLYAMSGYLLHFAIIERSWHGFSERTIEAIVGAVSLPFATAIWSWITVHAYWHKQPPK